MCSTSLGTKKGLLLYATRARNLLVFQLGQRVSIPVGETPVPVNGFYRDHGGIRRVALIFESSALVL
jgi:hypothetical protein